MDSKKETKPEEKENTTQPEATGEKEKEFFHPTTGQKISKR